MTTTQERRHERTRQEILDAALVLVGETGVDGWSMRRLASEVEYTVGALYRYFDDKAALLTALADSALAELYKRLRGASSGETGLHRIEALAHAYLEFASEEPTLFLIGLIETPSQRRSLQEPSQVGSAHSLLTAAVSESISAGEIIATADFGEEEIAFATWATVHGMAVLEMTHLRDFGADFAAVHREVVARLLLAMTQEA